MKMAVKKFYRQYLIYSYKPISQLLLGPSAMNHAYKVYVINYTKISFNNYYLYNVQTNIEEHLMPQKIMQMFSNTLLIFVVLFTTTAIIHDTGPFLKQTDYLVKTFSCKTVREGKPVVVLLDLGKAFDMGFHEMLINKTNKFVFRIASTQYLGRFLMIRQQYVKQNYINT